MAAKMLLGSNLTRVYSVAMRSADEKLQCGVVEDLLAYIRPLVCLPPCGATSGRESHSTYHLCISYKSQIKSLCFGCLRRSSCTVR
jgi:hypothetical protein